MFDQKITGCSCGWSALPWGGGAWVDHLSFSQQGAFVMRKEAGAY